MRFQSWLRWIGTTGSNARMFCVPLFRPDVEVGVVLERQDSEIADRILRLLSDIRLVGLGTDRGRERGDRTEGGPRQVAGNGALPRPAERSSRQPTGRRHGAR